MGAAEAVNALLAGVEGEVVSQDPREGVNNREREYTFFWFLLCQGGEVLPAKSLRIPLTVHQRRGGKALS